MKIKDLLDTWDSGFYNIVTIYVDDLDNIVYEGDEKSVYKSEFIGKTVKTWYVDVFPKDNMANISIEI
jgi:hypothetical protein